jgi:23S rRNA (cytosine1962-C5)-methyltransferase
VGGDGGVPIRWGRGYLGAMDLPTAIIEACRRRDPLHETGELTGYRLFHGEGDGVPGLTIDRMGELALIERSASLEVVVEEIADLLLRNAPVSRVALRGARREQRGPHPAPMESLRGETVTGPLEILEHGLRFLTAPDERRASGFFFDTRPVRRWLRSHSSGRRITNTFAHTGSLGVAAAVGGARSVLHIDNKRSPLEVAAEHHRRNGVPLDERSFLKGNVYQQLGRAGRRGVKVDGVVLDPPPVVPRRMAPRAPVGQDFPQLASLAAPLLAEGGWLLCCFNREDRSHEEGEREVLEGAGVPLRIVERGTSGIDFPATSPERRLRWSVFLRG